MIEEIPFRLIASDRNCAFYSEYKRDRLDIYKASEQWEDPVTLSVKVKYKIQSVKCDPDCDW